MVFLLWRSEDTMKAGPRTRIGKGHVNRRSPYVLV